MNLGTESERKEAFVRVYGDRVEVDDPDLECVTFDSGTSYSQFRSRVPKKLTDYPVKVVEFALDQYSSPVKRRRNYQRIAEGSIELDSQLKLCSADLEFSQGNNRVLLQIGYLNSREQYPDFLTAEVYPLSLNGAVMLAKCYYKIAEGLFPARIDITASSSQEVKVAADKPGAEKYGVPNKISITRTGKTYRVAGPEIDGKLADPNWNGNIGAEGGFARDRQLNYVVGIFPLQETDTLKVIRATEGEDLELGVPRFNAREIYTKITGDIRAALTIPDIFPVSLLY